MKYITLATVCLLGFASRIEAGSSSCGTFDSNMGATFDFTDLQRMPDEPAYSVEDGDLPCTKNVEQNYTYVFNVCGTVSGGMPDICKGEPNVGKAGALQINKRGTEADYDDWCYVVGEFSDSSYAVSLLDHDDPTKGIQLTYGGDYCHSGDQRKFNMQLMCSDKLNPVPTHALEYSHCSYTITMPSVYGCPLECPVSNRKVCGGNGHCSFDDDKVSARCFCNRGYSGADCMSAESSSSSSNYSPALLGLIITLFIIIVALIGSLWFMMRQLSAYKDDLANYQVLKGSPEDDTSAVV